MKPLRPVLCLLVLATANAAARAKDAEEVRVPDDPDAVVLSLDYWHGLEANATDDPVLRVLADGRVLAPDPWHGHGTAKGRLTADELAALVKFVVEEQRVFDIDAKDVQKRVSESPNAVPAIPDSAVTIVTVKLANRETKVEYLALDAVAARHADIVELIRLKAIVDRLDRLRVVTTAGGEKAVARWLGLANEALAKHDDDAEPFTDAELDDAFLLEKGARKIRFLRRDGDDWISATVVAPADDGEPEVTIASS